MTLAEYVAKVINADPAQVEIVGIHAEPGREWSEYTIEHFSCDIRYLLNGEPRSFYLGETEVADMLNALYPLKPEEAA